MANKIISDVICCVDSYTIDNSLDPTRSSAVYYIKGVDIKTFGPSNDLNERMKGVKGSGVKKSDLKGVNDPPWVNWETWGPSACNPIHSPSKAHPMWLVPNRHGSSE